MSAVLAADTLRFGYPGHSVSGPVSFAVAPGETLCLLGPNGGGKTTLFKTLLGLLPQQGGRVLIEGEDAAGWDARRRARALGYVPQSGAGPFPFTVHEMVLMGRTAHRGIFAAPSAADHDAAEAALATLGIAALSERDWLRLSGGERQLALIARALAQETRLLILDEPTASLDFGNQYRVLEQLRRLAGNGLAVVFSTHHPEQAFACATHVALLHDGRIAGFGPPAETITAAAMKLLYGIEVKIVRLNDGLTTCVPVRPR